ncbi:hydrogenase expression/formation C-terminal domain-containing protein [Methylacidimicrobium sp. B4]|uniref:hydrogenase expression/formation C-terminal domain-containing protein n=1 Tax=Methylacidimicrobium sp. B4 TaxID=2796139 RepID=UPI001A8D5FB3|nr:hydrogenase expression/formation C-terminal domain-containing protein [Methylacidimicrobium sp. B4]QSR84921.1 hypothetical protein MacB4_01185 [Methylacidimicrobium sp. B4]
MLSSRKSLIPLSVGKGKFPSSFEKIQKAKKKAAVLKSDKPFLDYAPRIEEALSTLERALLSQRLWERPTQIPLTGLAPEEQELLLGILGEGTAIVEAPGRDAQTAMATMLSGVWFTAKQIGAEEVSHAIDVGVLPRFVCEATDALPAVAPPPSSLAAESVAASAVLRELVEKAHAWERERVPREINLRLHPLLRSDYERLAAFLGQAPIIVWMEGRCRWWLFATQWRDVWRVEVRTSAGKQEASLLEIGRYPAAVSFPPSAFVVGARRVRRLLQLYVE